MVLKKNAIQNFSGKGKKGIRDEQYDTRIIDSTDTDTDTYSIDTWFLATLIRYLINISIYVYLEQLSHQRDCFQRLVKLWQLEVTSNPRMWT